MNLEKYQQYSRIARGLEKADLVLKNARIVNVFTEEIIRGDIAIQDGIIAGIGSFHGKEERDLAGRYVCPGFIDSHLHLESTLVTPAELVTVASRHGTTTFIVDPHESANVSGLAGIDYILDQTEDVKANVYVMMPSCVPATAIDDNGCTLTAEDMAPYLHNSRILGLGEVMDSISVVQGEKSMHDKLELFEGRIRDGLFSCTITFAIVNVLSDPVTPRRVSNWFPSLKPFTSLAIACGWSPVGLYSECNSK